MRENPSHLPESCQNCGTQLLGRYCYVCGQDARSTLVRLSEAIGRGIQTISNFDFRTLRTFVELFVPGRVQRRYLGGHRVGYASPIRAAISSSVALIFVAALFGPESSGVSRSGSMIDDLVAGASRFPEILTLQQLVALPVFVLLLMPLTIGRKKLLTEHLAIGLYLLSFVNFVCLLLFALSAAMPPSLQAPAALIGVISALVVGVLGSLRGGYGMGWVRAIITTPVGVLLFAIVNLTFLGVTMGIFLALEAEQDAALPESPPAVTSEP